MKVLFLHGLEGKPNGTKAVHLKELGHEVFAPKLPKEDLNLSIQIAKKCIEECNPDVIVGSSRGGAIAAALETKIGKIMIAPAYKAFGLIPHIKENDVILHCPDDDLVPFSFSEEISKTTGCSLIQCGKNHRMSDPDALFHLALYVPIIKFKNSN